VHICIIKYIFISDIIIQYKYYPSVIMNVIMYLFITMIDR